MRLFKVARLPQELVFRIKASVDAWAQPRLAERKLICCALPWSDGTATYLS